MKHNQFLKNEILIQQLSSMKEEIKDMQEHVIQLEKTLADGGNSPYVLLSRSQTGEIFLLKDWFKLQEEATPKTDSD